VPICNFPCATCVDNQPSTCTSCIYGFIYNTNALQNCQVNNTNCNQNMNCTYCALGFVLVVNNTQTAINQTCQACNTSCSRCMPNNINMCTGCMNPYYLYNYTCQPCFVGCASCSSKNICIFCAFGYVSVYLADVYDIYNYNIAMNCAPCSSPCQSCVGSPITCNTCLKGYYLNGTQCISNFNYQVTVTFANTTTNTQLNNQLTSFVQSVATAANVNASQVIIESITYSSIVVTAIVTTTLAPGSSAAITQ